MHVLVNPGVLAPIGGVELSTLQVNRELARRGHVITALYNQPGILQAQWQAFADDVVQVPTFDFTKSTALHDLNRLRPAVRAAAAARPDVIYLNRAEQTVWGLLAARSAGAPLVTHLRTHPDFPGVRLVGRMTGRFIAISHFVRDQWVKAGIRENSITVVHNGVDPAEYPAGGVVERAEARQSLGIPADSYVVLYYGRIAPEKGVDVLLDAWRELALPPEQATLLIVGADEGGPDRDYLDSLRMSQPPGCRWLPLSQDVMPALHAADVVTLPAQWAEPFGRVVIEGLASGRPVVGSRVGGVPEILSGEFSSLLVEPGDRASLAARLASLRDWRRDDPGLGPEVPAMSYRTSR